MHILPSAAGSRIGCLQARLAPRPCSQPVLPSHFLLGVGVVKASVVRRCPARPTTHMAPLCSSPVNAQARGHDERVGWRGEGPGRTASSDTETPGEVAEMCGRCGRCDRCDRWQGVDTWVVRHGGVHRALWECSDTQASSILLPPDAVRSKAKRRIPG